MNALMTLTPKTGYALVQELTAIGFIPRIQDLPSPLDSGKTDTVFFWRNELVVVREVEPHTYTLYELPNGTKVYETEAEAEATR